MVLCHLTDELLALVGALDRFTALGRHPGLLYSMCWYPFPALHEASGAVVDDVTVECAFTEAFSLAQ